MATTNKNLIKKGERILSDLLIEAENPTSENPFTKKVNGFEFIISRASCSDGCSMQPEVVQGPDGQKQVKYFCKRPDGSYC